MGEQGNSSSRSQPCAEKGPQPSSPEAQRSGEGPGWALHIHAPQPALRSVMAGTCLDCGKRTRFIGLMTPWYGWNVTCLRCGRLWCDGEWMPLAFERAARRRSIDSAKRIYRRAMPTSEVVRPLSSEAPPLGCAGEAELSTLPGTNPKPTGREA